METGRPVQMLLDLSESHDFGEVPLLWSKIERGRCMYEALSIRDAILKIVLVEVCIIWIRSREMS